MPVFLLHLVQRPFFIFTYYVYYLYKHLLGLLIYKSIGGRIFYGYYVTEGFNTGVSASLGA